jgi:hypothetical protein
MKRAVSFLLATTFFLSLGIVSFANTQVINRRERHQQRRIVGGLRSGELTYRETARLERQQASIRRYERHAKSDGHVSWRERQRIDNRLDRANRNIHRQKHDAQDRNP